MLISKPSYFDTFHCSASACTDSGCTEWDVQVDPDAAALYRSLRVPLYIPFLAADVGTGRGDTVKCVKIGRF